MMIHSETPVEVYRLGRKLQVPLGDIIAVDTSKTDVDLAMSLDKSTPGNTGAGERIRDLSSEDRKCGSLG